MQTVRKLERKAYSALHRHVLVNLPRHFEPSREPVTLVMPLADKDLAHAERTLQEWRTYLQHPIEDVIVPGQSSADISRFCRRVGARYIDETDVLPTSVKDFRYAPNGLVRNGWIRQQILKLMVDELSPSQRFLVVDSDTRPARPISFIAGGKPILFVSDEYNTTYFACAERLLGPLTWHSRSFIAHCMLLERDVLGELKAAIEVHTGKRWSDAVLGAIDTSVDAGFSEFETYGLYVMNCRPERFHTAYWYNIKIVEPDATKDFGVTSRERKYNFVSRHVLRCRQPGPSSVA